MKEFYYDKDKYATFPLGGIGTGVMSYSYSGELCGFDFCPAYSFGNANLTFSAEVYRDTELLSSKLIQCLKDGEYTEDKFVDGGVYVKFPFVKKVYEKSGFVGRLTQTVFTPFIPHNETDSGIPCAFFEFEIENTSDDVLKYTVSGICSRFFGKSINTVGCTDSGALYINSIDTKRIGMNEQSICLSTDAKSFSYNLGSEDGEFSITANFSLEPHEKKTVRFVFTWYFPVRENVLFPETRFSFETDEEYENRNITRNYYAQYFESSIECANYCFEHYERLVSETARFSDALYSSTLPDSFLKAISGSLWELRNSNVLRLGDGELYRVYEKDGKMLCDSLENEFALQFLYPLIDRTSTESIIAKPHLYDCVSAAVPVLRAFSGFLIKGDFEHLVENWMPLTKFIDALLVENTSKSSLLYAYGLKVGAYLASVVKDKGREEKCLEKLSEIPSVFGGDCMDALAHCDVFGMSENFEISRDVLFESHEHNPIKTAVALTRRGFHEEADRILCDRNNNGCYDASTAYALLNASSRLEYNAYEKYIRFNPEMTFADESGVFRCFFSLGTCYGYVERGIDYIEINILHGKLTVRNFGVPTRPLMVYYGGRMWKYTDEGLCARLDSDLVLTPEKKLTAIIDVTKKQA